MYTRCMGKRTKHLIQDVVGVLLIIIAPLFGWVPGPGGIPIFLAGLRLLAINHKWAERLLDSVKKHGLAMLDRIFVDHPVWKAAYDLVSAGLLIGGIYLLNTYTKSITLTLAIFLVLIGLAIFMGNRKRLQKLTDRLNKR